MKSCDLPHYLIKLVWPITPFTLLTIASIIISIQALIIAFTNDHTAAIYAAVVIPITLFIILLYVIDRLLISKISYLKIIIAEVIISVLMFLYFYY